MRKRYSRSYTVLSFLTMFSYRELSSGWRFLCAAIVSVGVDAHINPAVRTVFYGSPRRIRWYPWGDVGIAPYARREVFRSLVGADIPTRWVRKFRRGRHPHALVSEIL